ncbi:hypothetical protein CVT24_007913 [Panaeolus cyanescens]|uniref:cutinase n=1 Tax=Panaeolus cyanescens TaxID=181874 RepID=A0A409WWQ2_9AGAR|nr:hypothetical protein CVT24_007913 [Panaeolus cyanescens]
MVLFSHICSFLPLVSPTGVLEPLPTGSALVTESKNKLPCSDVYVFFARGSLEPPLLGPIATPFKQSLERILAPRSISLSFTGIDYPNLPEYFFLGGHPLGGRTMTLAVRTTILICPMSDIIISGYSHGAQLTHDTAFQLLPHERNRIAGVVTFGDPLYRHPLPPPLQARRLSFCHPGDNICDGDFYDIRAAHFSYHLNATDAAKFVAERVGRGGFGRAKL